MKVKNVLSKEEARAIGYRRFYCKKCKGYVLVKNTFGKIFCAVCREIIK